MQSEEKPVMATGLERIAAKARCEPKLFGSLDQGWLLRFVEHRVGDPRLIKVRDPLPRPKPHLPYRELQALAVL